MPDFILMSLCIIKIQTNIFYLGNIKKVLRPKLMQIHFIIIRRTMFRFVILPLFTLMIFGLCIFYIQGIESVVSVANLSGGEEIKAPMIPNNGGKLAIIIDDFGQSRAGVKEMMEINERLTFAVMPFLEFSEADAKNAHDKGYEVIVHLPMEPSRGKLSWLGPRPILADMKDEEVRQIVKDSFESVPYAVGANNHMGSRASSEENIMSGILDVIKEKSFYFVDSRTCDHPIGKKIADRKSVLCFDRDVFLDGNRSKSQIKKQIQEAEKIALKKGKAVAIGHVGAEGGKVTAEAIKEMLQEFKNNGIKLSFVSELEK